LGDHWECLFGAVDTSSLTSELEKVKTQLSDLQTEIQRLVDGDIESINLGKINGVRFFLDASSSRFWIACSTHICCKGRPLHPI